MIKKVLGVKIDDITKAQALEKVIGSIGLKANYFIIVTPGPEFLLTAQKDPEFKKILNTADLSLPDGFGLQLFGGIQNRVMGTDFMMELCRLSVVHHWTIGLVGGQKGVAKKAAENLAKKFPEINILAAIDGEEADKILSGYYPESFLKQSFDILFLAFGHPKQERLIWHLKIARCPFRVAMGVGGAFDYIAGKYPRPLKLVKIMGLEWLWRLATQPNRWRRIFKATIVFPCAILISWLDLFRMRKLAGG